MPRSRGTKIVASEEYYLADEASTRSLTRFFDEAEVPACFVYPSSESVAVDCGNLPTAQQLKKKVIVLYRVQQDVKIEKDNISDNVAIIELSKNVSEAQKGWSLYFNKGVHGKRVP